MLLMILKIKRHSYKLQVLTNYFTAKYNLTLSFCFLIIPLCGFSDTAFFQNEYDTDTFIFCVLSNTCNVIAFVILKK